MTYTADLLTIADQVRQYAARQELDPLEAMESIYECLEEDGANAADEMKLLPFSSFH